MAKKKLAPRKAASQKAKLTQKLAPKKVPALKKAKTKKAEPNKLTHSTSRSSSKSVKGGKNTSPVEASSLLHLGDAMPEFSTLNENGEAVQSNSLLGKKLVLYFYPKDDTPGCTQESCDFRDNFARVKKSGAQVFGISRDSVKSHTKFKEKYKLPFSLLSDEDGRICEAFGVWKEKNLYGRKYMGIERSTFLIDEMGQIFKIYAKVKVAGHVDQILEDLAIEGKK